MTNLRETTAKQINRLQWSIEPDPIEVFESEGGRYRARCPGVTAKAKRSAPVHLSTWSSLTEAEKSQGRALSSSGE